MATCTVNVAVHPRSRQQRVELGVEGTLRVSVHAPPERGKANDAVCSLLAKTLGVPASEVRIVAGLRGRHRVVELPVSLAAVRALLASLTGRG